MRNLNYFLVDEVIHKARLYQLDFITLMNRIFVKLEGRNVYYFLEYAKYFGRALGLLNYMYCMTNYGNLFADELTEWLLETGFKQCQCQMSIYYKYAPDGIKNVVLSYVEDFDYWYTYEDLVK